MQHIWAFDFHYIHISEIQYSLSTGNVHRNENLTLCEAITSV